MSESANLIAVYGTLRKGHAAHNNFMSDFEYIATDTVQGALYDLGWYPGWKDEEGSTCTVEVYRVPDAAAMVSLDQYEGCNLLSPECSLYNRKIVETEGGHRVWIYEYNGSLSPADKILSGDWAMHSEVEKEAC